jgi:hypothetical protein
VGAAVVVVAAPVVDPAAAVGASADAS